MINGFITIRVIDIIDILLVAYLMYVIYSLIKGTAAFNIFVGIITIYFLYRMVKALNMQLLESILGQVISVGVIALMIVFQQEIRRMLIFVGTRYFKQRNFSLEYLFTPHVKKTSDVKIKSIHKACNIMAKEKTGALIAITRKNNLSTYAEAGDVLNAETSSRILVSIFNKYSPLHDGAVIIQGDKVYAARCVLPVSENFNLPPHYGMRHRAGLGMSENTDALVIIVSEETGNVSIADQGEIKEAIDSKHLMDILENEF
jgi:uncharacterized protein (TIGR00159 family)